GEKTAASRLREADQRNGAVSAAPAPADDIKKTFERRAGRMEDFCNRFRRRLARPSVGGDAFRAVERGGIETGFLCEAGSGHSVRFRELVDRVPDSVMGEHQAAVFG